MLKRLFPLLAAAVLAALLLTASAEAKPLKKGSRGDRVTRLQQHLHLRPADGVFGPGTVRAVKRFQRRHHITADGVVGAGTWRMIRRARRRRAAARSRSTGRPRRRHRRGPSVRLLQRRSASPPTASSARAPPARSSASSAATACTADGIVGPATWTALGIRGRHPVLKRATAARQPRVAAASPPRSCAARSPPANRIASAPYIYGGGHGSFTRLGLRLLGLGLLRPARRRAPRRPLDSGELMSYGSPGPGRYITIYANPGHAYMVIRGRRYDTSASAPPARAGPGAAQHRGLHGPPPARALMQRAGLGREQRHAGRRARPRRAPWRCAGPAARRRAAREQRSPQVGPPPRRGRRRPA